MRARSKVLLAVGMTTALTLGSALSAFAGTWRSQTRWQYELDNGAYAQNGWQWIDGNNDGIAECYYFDSEGWLLINAVTPEGYTVNGNGAWTVNGVVQTTVIQQPQNPAAGGQTQVSADYGQIYGAIAANDYSVFEYAMEDLDKFLSEWGDTLGLQKCSLEQRAAAWAQHSALGAAWKEVLDRYNMAALYETGEFPETADENEKIMLEMTVELFWGMMMSF